MRLNEEAVGPPTAARRVYLRFVPGWATHGNDDLFFALHRIQDKQQHSPFTELMLINRLATMGMKQCEKERIGESKKSATKSN